MHCWLGFVFAKLSERAMAYRYHTHLTPWKNKKIYSDWNRRPSTKQQHTKYTWNFWGYCFLSFEQLIGHFSTNHFWTVINRRPDFIKYVERIEREKKTIKHAKNVVYKTYKRAGIRIRTHNATKCLYWNVWLFDGYNLRHTETISSRLWWCICISFSFVLIELQLTHS